MKIDTHVHVTPPDIIRDFEKICEREPYFSLLSHSKQNRFATAEDVVSHMKVVGIDKSVVFGFGFQDMGLCRYVNDYVMEQVKRYPNELIGFAAVVPNHPEVEVELERCVKGGLKGIGELFPAGQNFQIGKKEDTIKFVEGALHYNLPVLIHTNEPIGHDYVGKTNTSLKEIEAFITYYPELKIILAHWGGGIFIYELMKEIKAKFQNVYYDTAAMIYLYEPQIYETAKQLGILNKVLFGSDYPLLSPSRYEKGFSLVNLTEAEWADVRGENAKKLFDGISKIR